MDKRIWLVISMVIVLIVLFILWTTGSIGLTSDDSFNFSEKELMQHCLVDDDCIIVDGKACCSCGDAINKKFLDQWNNLEQVTNCPRIACDDCRSPLSSKCVENKCTCEY
jgi:hypothetical protein